MIVDNPDTYVYNFYESSMPSEVISPEKLPTELVDELLPTDTSQKAGSSADQPMFEQASTSSESSGSLSLSVVCHQDSETSTFKASSEVNNVCPKLCAVCGSAATGYHYDAPSCNGCKTFFRRTVLKGRKYECKNAKRCSLSDGRRGLCRACRYDRCLVSGMNPLLIQVTSDDVVSMENISKCLNRKRVFTEDKPTSLVISNKNLTSITGMSQYLMLDYLNDLLELEEKLKFLKLSTFRPESKPQALMEQLQSPSLLDDLSQFKALTELQLKCRCIEGGGCPDRTLPSCHDPFPFPPIPGVKHWMLCGVVLAVEFAKAFPFFSDLSLSDKYALAKGTVAMTSVLEESFYSYVKKSDTIVFPDGIMPLYVTRKPIPLFRYILKRSVEVLINSEPDSAEYALMRAIIFANDTVEGLSEKARKVLKREKERYAQILFNYVMNKYGSAKGAVKYMDYIAVVNSFINFGAKRKQLHSLMMVLRAPPKDIFKIIDDALT